MKLYVNMLSQPSRYLMLMCDMSGILYDKHIIKLETHENQSEEYLKINPLGQVPFLVDNGLNLAESTSIVRYLMNKYPQETDLLRREKHQHELELFFTYYHTNIRKINTMFAYTLYWPKLGDSYKDKIEYLRPFIQDAIHMHLLSIERMIHDDINKDISIIDIITMCEFIQLNVCGVDIHRYPVLFQLMQKFKGNKHAREVNIVVEKMCKKRDIEYWLDL